MTISNAIARDYRFPLFQVVLIALGTALCLYGWFLAEDARKSGFARTQCLVEKVEINRYYQNRFGWFGGERLVKNPVVSCRYHANGKERWMQERCATDTPLGDGGEAALEYLRDHPPGSSVEILYNPGKPNNSFVARDTTMKEYWPFVPGLFLMGVGGLWLFAARRALRRTGGRSFAEGETAFTAEESGIFVGMFLMLMGIGGPLAIMWWALFPLLEAWNLPWPLALFILVPFLPIVVIALVFLGHRRYVHIDRATGFFLFREHFFFPSRVIRDRASAIESITLGTGPLPGRRDEGPLLLRTLLFLLTGKGTGGTVTNPSFRAGRITLSMQYKGDSLLFPSDVEASPENAQRLARLIGCRLVLPEGVQETVAQPPPEPKKVSLPGPAPASAAESVKKADYRTPFAWFAILWGSVFTVFFGWAAYKSAVAYTWNEAPGMIVGFESTNYRADYGFDVTVKYTYEVGGRYYTGDRMAASASNRHVGRFKLHDWDRRFGHPGRPVAVYYDPGDPATAVLAREDIQAVVCLVMGLVSIAIGQYLRNLLKRERSPSPGQSAGFSGKTGFIKGGSVFRAAEHRWYLGAFILIAFSPAIVEFFLYQRDMGFPQKMMFMALLAVSLPLLFYTKESVVDKQTGMFTFFSSMIIPFRRYATPLGGINYVELNTSQQESGDENYNLALVVVTDGGRFDLASTAAFATPQVARRLAVLVDRPVKFTGIRAFWHLEDAEESPDTAKERLQGD